MGPADLWVPAVAVVLVTALAVFAATRPGEPAGAGHRAAAGVLTTLVAGWLLAVPVLVVAGGPLPGGGGSGYLAVLVLRAVPVVALLVTFWRRRTRRALSVAALVALLMALPELAWVLGR